MSLGKIRQEEDVLWSFAPHDVSMVLSLLGCEPDRVEAIGSNILHDAVADLATIHLHFPGGQRAHILVSWLHPFKEHKLIVVGSEAMAVFDDTNDWGSKLLYYPHRVQWRNHAPVPVKADPAPVTLEAREPLRQECLHFLECAATGATPRTDGREGLRVLSVLTRAVDSLGTKRAGIVTTAPRPVPIDDPAIEMDRSDVTIHESAYIDSGVQIGPGSKIWHFSHIFGNVSLGRAVVVGQNVVIGPDVTIGDRCKIQNNVSVYKGVTLEEGVFCGPSCVFTNVNNPRAEVERKSEFRPTWVKRGASIGANATIVCGHTIGEYAFIAAGAVVTSDVPAFALMAGVPARRIGWMSRAGVKLGPDLTCPESGLRYREVAPGHLEEIAP
jgi:acetyltransferase-like isoleucine patch superfamily enzyme